MASGLRPGTVDRGRLPVQPRDRRAALSALALLLVVAGALGSALVVYRSGHRVDVLVAAREIKPGQQLGSQDYAVARVASDSGKLIRATDARGFDGSFATVDVPAGTLLNPTMFLNTNVIPSDGVIVGVTLPQNRRPAGALAKGDVVRVYEINTDVGASVGTGATPTPAAGATPVIVSGAKVLVDVARVVDAPTSTSNNTDQYEISLLLKASDAQNVVLDNAGGALAVALLPSTSTPAIDFRAAAASTPSPAA